MILHFTWQKPWNSLHPASLLYWKYYCLFFPAEEAFDRITKQELNKLTPLFQILLQNELLQRQNTENLVALLSLLVEQGLTKERDLDDMLPLFQFLLRNKRAKKWLKRFFQISEQGIMKTLYSRIAPIKRKTI